MKITTESLKNMIREALTEMASSDDFDMGAHVKQKRLDRMSRGEPDPRNIPAGDDSGTHVDSPSNTRETVVGLIKQAGGDEALADSIMAAVQKMKEDGLI
jgi:hypothetical protein